MKNNNISDKINNCKDIGKKDMFCRLYKNKYIDIMIKVIRKYLINI